MTATHRRDAGQLLSSVTRWLASVTTHPPRMLGVFPKLLSARQSDSPMGKTQMQEKSRRYELRMVAILSVVQGLVGFEQIIIFFLFPFIQLALGLNNTQIGLLTSGYWLAFAISSFAMSALADILGPGKWKVLLISAMVAMSLCSVLSGLATSFVFLLITRALMGLWEGPIRSISQAVAALESPPERQSLNMGIVVNVGCGISQGIIAPLVVVKIAILYGWRSVFFAVIVPGLLCTALTAWFLPNPYEKDPPRHDLREERQGVTNRLTLVLTFRNVWLCAALCCLSIAYVNAGFTFLPLFMVNVRHLSADQTDLMMGTLAVSILFFGLVLPAVANFLGRKSVMIIASALGVICPLSAIYYQGSVTSIFVLFFLGFALPGAFSLAAGTIPSETVPVRNISTAIGFVLALGVLGGGLTGPAIAGWGADHWGLVAALVVQAACAVVALLVSVALIETARAKTN
jgi:ACS family hexuronate transporter-like MFS transporter